MARSQNTGAFFVATLVLWLVSVIFEIVFNRRRELLPIIAGCFFYQFANWVIRFAVSKDPIFVNTSVSLLHSSITSLSVILILVNQWMANGPGKMFEHSQLFAATWPGAYPALCFSSGYFAYDQWDMLHYRLYSGLIPSILVHHLILLVCFTLALFRNITINYLILTLICERAATECLKTVLNNNVCGISSVFSTWGFMTMEDIDSSKQVYHDETYGDWVHAREILRSRLILEDDFTWRLPTTRKKELGEKLKYVGGVDLSFSKEDPCMACGALVVVDLDNNFNVVYEDFSVVNLRIPYIPGFLAFREAPVLLELLEKMKSKAHPFYPQLLMVDGNGLLHPHGFGLACHLGVLASLPTIGIGKNLLHVDGLAQSEVRRSLKADDLITLTGHSGHTWGVAMRSTHDSLKPIFISIGHRISLHTAVEVVKLTCKYRVPEPIRQADIRSRAILLKHPKSLQTIQIKKMHSIFLHTRKVRRMAGIRDAKSKIVRVEWVLSWITFFVARLATHILIIIKLVIDAGKFNKGIELPLALSGMIGMNVLNIFLGLDLWKAYKRETNGLQNHQD